MKKQITILILCFIMLLCGCATKTQKYQRISLDSDTLGEDLAKHISDDTVVTNKATEELQTQIPIYTITERSISDQAFQQMLTQFGLQDVSSIYQLKLDGNEIHGAIAGHADPLRGDFDALDMTEEELEELAWDTLHKIPFIDADEYEYLGIKSEQTYWTASEGEVVNRVGVAFRRIVDGVRVISEDRCDLHFDGSGFVEMHLALFDYEKTGTMDMVTLKDAIAKIKTPDDFSIDTEKATTADTLQVDRIKLVLVNQYSKGCTILQPVYYFSGIASLEDGSEAEFSSKVIAIPESYTYEKDDEAAVS